jgi:uncharacterized RDD family membrane protein YckC
LAAKHDNFWTMNQEYIEDRPYLPDPATAPQLFEGVLTRRVVAYVIDLGLAWAALPFAVLGVIVLYYAATLGSSKRATLGMQMMDIVLTPTRGQPLDGWMAILHALLFWVSFWISWPISLIFALFTPRRQMIHDLIVGTLMVRRSPMMRHWQNARREGNY